MKKIIIAALFAAVAIVGGYKAYSYQNVDEVILSDLAKNNVEALAEDGDEITDEEGCKLSLLRICVTKNKDHHLFRNL